MEASMGFEIFAQCHGKNLGKDLIFFGFIYGGISIILEKVGFFVKSSKIG